MNFRSQAMAAVALILGLVVVSGCGGGADASSAGASSTDRGVASEPAPAKSASRDDPASGIADVQARSVISTGSVALRTKDVSGVRDQVVSLSRELGGFLADEDTSTDPGGEARASRLELRVPSAGFGTAMSRISRLGRLVRATRSAKDVTTEVIDVDERVRAQRIGLRRLETLLGRAGRLSDVLAVERQITDRRAELDSLRSQQAYLRSQTSLATIGVWIQRTTAPVAHQKHTGFGYGLEKGWHALTHVVVAAVTAAGALLPFAVVLLVLGVPVALLRRRRHRGDATQPPTQDATQEATQRV